MSFLPYTMDRVCCYSSFFHHKVSRSYISRMVLPRITNFINLTPTQSIVIVKNCPKIPSNGLRDEHEILKPIETISLTNLPDMTLALECESQNHSGFQTYVRAFPSFRIFVILQNCCMQSNLTKDQRIFNQCSTPSQTFNGALCYLKCYQVL